MHTYTILLVVTTIVAFFIFYDGKRVRTLLGVSDDLNTTFFGQTISFQGPSGYCGVRSQEVPIVDCQRTKVTDSELFDVIKTGECSKRPDGKTECQFALRSKLSGKVCADEGNRILCTRNVPGPWEKFAFIKQPGLREFSFPGAKSGTARKACLDKGSAGIVCDGGKEAYGSKNAVFRWSLPSDAATAPPPATAVVVAPTPITTATTTPLAPSAPTSTAISSSTITSTINDIAKAVIAARDAAAASTTTTTTTPVSTTSTTSPTQMTVNNAYQYCMDATQGNMEAFERCMTTTTTTATSPTSPPLPSTATTPSPQPAATTDSALPAATTPNNPPQPSTSATQPASSAATPAANAVPSSSSSVSALPDSTLTPTSTTEIMPSSATMPSPATAASSNDAPLTVLDTSVKTEKSEPASPVDASAQMPSSSSGIDNRKPGPSSSTLKKMEKSTTERNTDEMSIQTPLVIAGSVIAGLVVLRMIMPSSSAPTPYMYYPPR